LIAAEYAQIAIEIPEFNKGIDFDKKSPLGKVLQIFIRVS
jgi:hypothetical protein